MPRASKTTLLRTCLIAGLLPLAGRAVTAVSLGSFESIKEPLVRYSPATNSFHHDDLQNISDLGDGSFRMSLRYRHDAWDADRDTFNKDRQPIRQPRQRSWSTRTMPSSARL